MKHEKISIKWKIFLFLLIFILILLVVLWLLQICYLDSFYKYVRNKTAEKVKEEVMVLLEKEEEDISRQLDLLAAKNNLAIYITDMNGRPLYNAEYIATSRLNTIPKEEFEMYYQRAKENNGSAKILFHGNRRGAFFKEPPIRDDIFPKGQPQTDVPQFMQNHGLEHAESVIYVTILEMEEQEIVFFLNCMLTPVDATVDTLKAELLFISVLMLILSIGLAILMAKQISKSMIRLSDSAKELAQGRFDVEFAGRDYKEIAELSDTLNYMAKELAKTEKLRQELIANVSHDLRTPLTMITAYAQAMQDLPGEDTAENLQVVIDEAVRLSNLVNDMLDISKLQAGISEKNAQNYNLTEGICLVLERYNKLVEQDGYRIEFIYQEDAWVTADIFKMEQVLYNLVNNAIHYTGKEKTVVVKQMIFEETVRVEVSDEGEGIAEEDIPYIWERYYKVDKSHKRTVQGSGLGLSIVKNILELHEASYGVESRLGEGSTFWFELKRNAV